MTAYLLARVNVTNPEKYEDYKALAPAAIEKHGGKYIARGGRTVTVEGPEVKERMVLLEFPDVEAAEKFYNSPEYQAAKAKREGAAEGQFVIIEGL